MAHQDKYLDVEKAAIDLAAGFWVGFNDSKSSLNVHDIEESRYRVSYAFKFDDIDFNGRFSLKLTAREDEVIEGTETAVFQITDDGGWLMGSDQILVKLAIH